MPEMEPASEGARGIPIPLFPGGELPESIDDTSKFGFKNSVDVAGVGLVP